MTRVRDTKGMWKIWKTCQTNPHQVQTKPNPTQPNSAQSTPSQTQHTPNPLQAQPQASPTPAQPQTQSTSPAKITTWCGGGDAVWLLRCGCVCVELVVLVLFLWCGGGGLLVGVWCQRCCSCGGGRWCCGAVLCYCSCVGLVVVRFLFSCWGAPAFGRLSTKLPTSSRPAPWISLSPP